MKLDIRQNRTSIKYTRKVLLCRVLWSICQPLFRYSPRTAFGWRRFVLRCFGATVGREVHIYNSATIYMPWNLVIDDWSSIGEWVLVYNIDRVFIGKQATISSRAHLCCGTHDYTRRDLPLVRKPVSIGDQAWICADAFIGPGVNVGQGAITGARAVVVKDVAPWTIVAGNPAQHIKDRVLSNE